MAPFDRAHTIVTMVPSCIVYLLVENRKSFRSHLYLVLPQGVTPSEFRKDV